ncbi:MAG: DUF481 domain-containing protein [Planctomycetota bacterium]|jgi:hypothetical protein
MVRAILVLLLCTTAFAADEVRLKGGDKLQGTIVERNEDTIVLDHPDLGRLTIPMERIESFTGQKDEVESEDPSPLEQEVEALAKEKPKAKWKGSTTLGGVFTNDDDGQELRFNFRGTASRSTERGKLSLLSSWILANDDGEVDTNTFYTVADYSWVRKKGMRRYWWLQGRYDYDDFRSWQQRLTAHFGVGYNFWDTDKFRFAGTIGLGGRKEWGSDGDPHTVEGALGMHLRWLPRERQALQLSLIAFPALEQESSRTVVTFDWKVLVDRKIGMSFNTHLDWEYDTDPDPGFPEHTIRWTWGLQFNF